ncbi:unnamed protein product, partial [Ilex paraguariensis]
GIDVEEVAHNLENRGHRIDDRPLKRDNNWDHGLKIDVDEFEGRLQPKEFFNW